MAEHERNLVERGIIFRLVWDYLPLSPSLSPPPLVIARVMLVAGLLAMRQPSFEIRLCSEVVIYTSFVFPCFYASVLYTARLTRKITFRRPQKRSIYIYYI